MQCSGPLRFVLKPAFPASEKPPSRLSVLFLRGRRKLFARSFALLRMTSERTVTWRSFSFPHRLICRNGFAAIMRTEQELWIGFYKKNSGKPSITWPESVDEALCVGWIDGIRKSIDAESYMIRFTPRRRGSIWSAVNIKRVEVLTNEKRMQPPGLAAFAARRENKSGIYSYEQRGEHLPEPYAGLLRRNKKAWEFFEAQPPSLPQDDRLVGGECEAGKDAPEAAAKADRGICQRPSPVAGASEPGRLAGRHVACRPGSTPPATGAVGKSSS